MESIETLPQYVIDILEKHYMDDETYYNCELLTKELNSVGYTCDYGLDGIAYDLKPIQL